YPLVFIRGWLLGTAKRTGALRARTHRRRNRNARRSSRFLFFAFRSLSFSLRFLLFGQRPKFHNLCLHRTIRHFVIRASHFLFPFPPLRPPAQVSQSLPQSTHPAFCNPSLSLPRWPLPLSSSQAGHL